MIYSYVRSIAQCWSENTSQSVLSAFSLILCTWTSKKIIIIMHSQLAKYLHGTILFCVNCVTTPSNMFEHVFRLKTPFCLKKKKIDSFGWSHAFNLNLYTKNLIFHHNRKVKHFGKSFVLFFISCISLLREFASYLPVNWRYYMVFRFLFTSS